MFLSFTFVETIVGWVLEVLVLGLGFTKELNLSRYNITRYTFLGSPNPFSVVWSDRRLYTRGTQRWELVR